MNVASAVMIGIEKNMKRFAATKRSWVLSLPSSFLRYSSIRASIGPGGRRHCQRE